MSPYVVEGGEGRGNEWRKEFQPPSPLLSFPSISSIPLQSFNHLLRKIEAPSVCSFSFVLRVRIQAHDHIHTRDMITYTHGKGRVVKQTKE